MSYVRKNADDRPGRRDRVRRLRAIHRAWETENGHYEPKPVALLYDVIGGPLMSHPVFVPLYYAAGQEAAIQALIGRYGLDDAETQALRDLVERTIRRA